MKNCRLLGLLVLLCCIISIGAQHTRQIADEFLLDQLEADSLTADSTEAFSDADEIRNVIATVVVDPDSNVGNDSLSASDCLFRRPDSPDSTILETTELPLKIGDGTFTENIIFRGSVGAGSISGSPTARFDVRGGSYIWNGTGEVNYVDADHGLYVQNDIELDNDLYLSESSHIVIDGDPGDPLEVIGVNLSGYLSWLSFDSLVAAFPVRWSDSSSWAGYVHWDSIRGIPSRISALYLEFDSIAWTNDSLIVFSGNDIDFDQVGDSLILSFSDRSNSFIHNQNDSTQDADFIIEGSGEVGHLRIRPDASDSALVPQAGNIRTMGFG